MRHAVNEFPGTGSGLGCRAELRQELSVQMGCIQGSRVFQLRGLKAGRLCQRSRVDSSHWDNLTNTAFVSNRSYTVCVEVHTYNMCMF